LIPILFESSPHERARDDFDKARHRDRFALRAMRARRDDGPGDVDLHRPIQLIRRRNAFFAVRAFNRQMIVQSAIVKLDASNSLRHS
jgi:hypothetical protein